jgi:HEAT repeat protein
MGYRTKVAFISMFIIAAFILFTVILLQPALASAASGSSLPKSASPTASAISSSTTHSTGGLDLTIWVALIGVVGVVIGALINNYYQRRTEQKKQQGQFKHDQEIARLQREQEQQMARLQKELEAQYKVKEQEEEHQASTAEALRLKMLQTPGSERTETYRLALHADPRISQLQILDMSRPLEITNIYVRVRLHQEASSGYELDPTIRKAEKMHNPNILLEAGFKYLERRSSSAVDPDEAIRTYKRCVFVGDPGAGKTMLLKYLTLKSADNQLSGLPDLPIRIELNAFVTSGYQDLLDFAAADWDERYGFPKGDARAAMEERLKEGKALLLFDALDETVIGDTPDAAEASYQRVTDAIIQIATRYAQSPIVVTARKAGYQQHQPLAGFTELEVLDFRREDIRDFVTKWFDCYPDPLKRANGADLNAKLERNSRLQALAANPLLLSLIILVYEAQLDLPARRAELYKRCVETLLTEWDAERNIRRRHEFKAEHKRQLLTEIAWHFHLQGQRYFAEQEVLTLVADFLPKVRLAPELNSQILTEIANEHGLLKEQARGWQGFLHLTLQEYFVAQYVTDHQLIEQLLAHYDDPWWEEVILLYARSTPDASLLLRKLLGEDTTIREDLFQTGLVMAGRCLAARPTLQQPVLRENVISELFKTLTSTSYMFIVEQIADVLAALGDEEVNQHLLLLVANEQIDRYIRGRIAGALGTLGERAVALDLVKLVANEQIDSFVREWIAEALGALGERAVALDLMKLVANEQIDRSVRVRIAGTLGTLGERAVALDLVKLVANEQIDSFVRERIAEALGTLGERAVVPDLVKLVANEQIDRFIRGRIVGALGTLGERAVALDLVKLMANKQIARFVRESIARTLGMLGERAVALDLVKLVANEQIDRSVRESIARTLGTLGERAVVPDLVKLVANEQIDSFVRGRIAGALGTLGERAVALDLVKLVANEQIDSFVRVSIAEALGMLGERAVVPDLVKLVANEQIARYVRVSIAEALGMLGERAVVSDLVKLVANGPIALHVRVRIAEALGMLGERAVAPDLVKMVANEQIDHHVRVRIAGALGTLGERAVVPDLVKMVANEQIDRSVRQSIAGALGTLIDDEATIYLLAALLPDSDIADSIHRILWTVSRRCHVRIFINDKAGEKQLEVVKW